MQVRIALSHDQTRVPENTKHSTKISPYSTAI